MSHTNDLVNSYTFAESTSYTSDTVYLKSRGMGNVQLHYSAGMCKFKVHPDIILMYI